MMITINEKHERYLNLVLEQNKTMNLTGITGMEEARIRHMEDSLSLLPLLPEEPGLSVIDVGAGGGFPGLPLKIARPDIKLTLLDATAKKVDFLRRSADALGLSDTAALHGRAEIIAAKPPHRENYDIAVSRGVARLDILSELCLPFIKTGGLMLAMKQDDSELPEAEEMIAALGGKAEDSYHYTLSNGLRHTVICIRKISRTQDGYPRRFAKIKGK
jgi:16S rRNA (guanine527-N7)-methyltransferase